MEKLASSNSFERHHKDFDSGEKEKYLAPDPLEGDLFNSGDFTMMVMAQDSVTLVTSL